MFLPVVGGQGGIGGTQVLTLVIRGIALGDLPGRRALRLLAREVLLGLAHGLFLGIAIALVAFGWKSNGMLGVVVGVAVGGNMVVAGLTGAAIPLVLRRLGLDPALGSAVIVTTATDVGGFLLLLGMGSVLVDAP
jgi:magnesium transporter